MERRPSFVEPVAEHRNALRVSIIIVGCGNRGQIYANYHKLCPSLCEVVGIAEPREITRNKIAQTYGLSSDRVFKDWRDLAKVPKFADAVVIATQDKEHFEPTLAFADLYVEKPMSTSLTECEQMAESIKRNGVIFAVGHVLRYTTYSRKFKELLDSGLIGKAVCMQHLEPVGWFHFAHSYVRGSWSNEAESSPVLMSKSCHDIDWMRWIMGKKVSKVSSFGSLVHFNKISKPEGAGDNCLTCAVESTCPYSAKKLYLDGPLGVKTGNTGFPLRAITEDFTAEGVLEALEKGPYGRCVYECNNDVNDNQVVNIQFEDGSTASFTMVAFSEQICVRKTKIFGTLGEIEGDGETSISVFEFATQRKTVHYPEPAAHNAMSGHGGGDFQLMKAFIRAVATNDQSLVCDVDETLKSHFLVFEAEKSRKQNSLQTLNW